MHAHEETLIDSFIARDHRPRWREQLVSAKRRARFLDRLNHCTDFDPRCTTQDVDALAPPAVAELLRSLGAPETCYVVSSLPEIDGREMPLADAIAAAEEGGWGTLIGCTPGRLAYYVDERGSGRRLILHREAR